MTDEILKHLAQHKKTLQFGAEPKHSELRLVDALRVAVEGFKETIIMSEKDSKYQDDAVNRVLKMRAKEIATILGVKEGEK